MFDGHPPPKDRLDPNHRPDYLVVPPQSIPPSKVVVARGASSSRRRRRRESAIAVPPTAPPQALLLLFQIEEDPLRAHPIHLQKGGVVFLLEREQQGAVHGVSPDGGSVPELGEAHPSEVREHLLDPPQAYVGGVPRFVPEQERLGPRRSARARIGVVVTACEGVEDTPEVLPHEGSDSLLGYDSQEEQLHPQGGQIPRHEYRQILAVQVRGLFQHIRLRAEDALHSLI
mmetsp:Transcript_18326/g.52908  ORF Transcript_18326/g.52908 Transcript_18326/m.52908 type:complete len:229 (-) Transcript_18326:615-1301(-)